MNSRILAAASIAAVALAGCGGGSAEQTIAKVNGQDIDRETYLKQLETMSEVVVIVNGQRVRAQLAEPLSSQALSQLIEQQIILQTALDEGVMPSKEDIEKEKSLQTSLNPEFLNQMKAQGFLLEDVDRLLQLQLAKYRLGTRGIPEQTIEDAKEYVKKNPKQFERGEQVAFRYILVDNEEKRAEVDRDLRSGITFGAVAGKHSVIPTANMDNGAYNAQGTTPRPVAIAGLNDDLKAVINKTEQGGTSDWVKMGNAWAKIRVESKIPAQQVEPNAAQLEILRRALTEQDAGGANNLNDMFVKKLLASEIQVYPAYLKRSWETMLTNIKQRVNEVEGGTAAATQPANGQG